VGLTTPEIVTELIEAAMEYEERAFCAWRTRRPSPPPSAPLMRRAIALRLAAAFLREEPQVRQAPSVRSGS
jgi:hypothetical protein